MPLRLFPRAATPITLVIAVLTAVVIGSVGSALAAAGTAPRAGQEVMPPPRVAPDEGRPVLRFTSPAAAVAAEPNTATLDVPGPGGNFRVPYIQTGPELNYALELNGPPGRTIVDIVLDAGKPTQQVHRLHSPPWSGTFRELGYGEHTLDARLYAPEEGAPETLALVQPPVVAAHLDHVARGDIVAALGDSVTEGLGGNPYAPGEIDRLHYFPDWVAARQALAPVNPGAVSADGRNFPQAGGNLKPASRQGYLVSLAQSLGNAHGRPVLVINEGWSGITADGFLHVSESEHFQHLVATTRPNIWLIDLGANDVLVKRPGNEYEQLMRGVVASLELKGAISADIHIACPSFRAGATEPLQQTYLPAVNNMRSSLSLGPAPDFFGAYRDHPELRQDWVHPSAAGYAAMARMWTDAIGGAGSGC
jgi:lysophospholipase L1-like esterase